jgi:diguanylate cyclase (GGDEF)-like protein
MPSSRSPSAETGPDAQDIGASPAIDDSMRRRFVEVARRAEIVGLVNAATTEPELGRRFTDELCEVFDAEFAFLLDEGGERRSPRAIAVVGVDPEGVPSLLDRTECKQALESQRAMSLTGDDVLGLGATSAVIAPFRAEDDRTALVGVGRLHDAPFDETDRALVEAVTLASGQALERIWSYEARNRTAKEQAALVRAAKSMGRSLELSEVLSTLCEEVAHGLECDSVAAALGDEVDGYIVLGAAGDLPEDFVGFRQPPGSGLGGRAAHAARTLVTQRYQEDGLAPPETSALDRVEVCMATPLRWEGRIRGFVTAGFQSQRRITKGDMELLEGFAELASMALGNAERHAEVRVAAEFDGLTGCLNRDALQRQLRQLMAESDESGASLAVAILDLDGFKSINDVFGHPSGDAVLKNVGAALRSSVRAGDVVARYGGDEFALLLPDASEQQAAPVLDRVRAAIRSLEVPGGRLTACVGLAERSEGESIKHLIARADEALREAKGSLSPGSVRRASRPVSAARATAGDGSALDRRQRWRAVAGDIGLGVARETDSVLTASVATAELQDVLQLEICTVLQLVSGGRLEVIAEAGPSAPSEQLRDAEQGLIGRALRAKSRIMDGDEAGAGRRASDIDGRGPTGEDAVGEVAVPLIIGGRAWGAVSCVAGRRRLDEIDAELIVAVAEHLSAAIRTADLYDQLTQSMIGTAEALAAALEAKDSYTADHARSIADLAVAVGRELQLSESALEDLRYGGIFHDVGKIAIPDALINKPGPLTEEEFEVIKEHPAIGAEILAPVPFLYGVRTIVRHAHEHWDGGGYPEGLKGEQIPLGARIVLAVDAYHAMTSDRPYRKAMSHEEACRELEANAGTQFDPEVIEAVLAVLDHGDVPDTSDTSRSSELHPAGP